jgi:hypothetical protein
MAVLVSAAIAGTAATAEEAIGVSILTSESDI